MVGVDEDCVSVGELLECAGVGERPVGAVVGVLGVLAAGAAGYDGFFAEQVGRQKIPVVRTPT